ncbi:MAG: LL-diaminopimelate aminotransferase [bacterium]
MINCSKRLNTLPPYIFTKIDKLKKEAYSKKLDVIDLGMGNPDLPLPSRVLERLCDTVVNHPRTHRYPQAKGMPKFRICVSEWFYKRFGVKIDPEREALALIGSKEGVAHLCQALLNFNDLALVPDPAYPVYYNGIVLAGGKTYKMPLLEKNGFLPDLTKIPAKIARKAKMMFINYPNNPTTAVVEDLSFFKDIVKFAKKYNIIVCHDNAYSEVVFDGYQAPSFLQVKGGKDVAVEFHSFSKTYSMAGWRIGFAVGNEYILGALEKFKAFVDYGISTFIQLSGVVAIEHCSHEILNMRQIYAQRRDRFIKEFKKIGWEITPPKATMYLWTKIPDKFKGEMNSLEFCEYLVKETGIVFAPGLGFGEFGDGYVRIALVTHENRFYDAAQRIKSLFKTNKK